MKSEKSDNSKRLLTILTAIVILLAFAVIPTMAADPPDLIVSSININPDNTRAEDIVRVYVNESNNISAVVNNTGTGDVADSFDVCFDADGTKIGCAEVASLTAGASIVVSIEWTPTCADYSVMPGFPAQSLPITINVIADCNCTDCPTCPADGSNGQIAELDETNNTLSKVIPVIQQYSAYDVIGGVVNNGYKSKNFDCNTTEEPLTLSGYDSEIVGGGVVYNVSGEKISSFAPGNNSTRIHHIDIPNGATVKKVRLYVYWYDKWDNYMTYPTGCLADLSVNFSGTTFTTPDAAYNDQKGFGYYHSPKGTYAYDVTSEVTGSGDYTVVVENIDPANSTTLLGEMLFVVYEGADNNKKIQLWTLEGNDYLMAADDTHGSYNYGVSPEEATATVAFPGSIDLANVSSATLVSVVAQGMEDGSSMLFNNSVNKNDAWNSSTEAYPNSKINIESVDVKSYLASSSNNMGFQDTGTTGMQASNAILMVEYAAEGFELPFPVIPPGTTTIGNITVDAFIPANVGENATLVFFGEIAVIDSETYYVSTMTKPVGGTKFYMGADFTTEDFTLKRVVGEGESGVELANLTFDPAYVMFDYPMWLGKTWTATVNVTGTVNATGTEIPVDTTAVITGNVTEEVYLSVPYGTDIHSLVVEVNASLQDPPISKLEKYWLCGAEDAIIPKYQRYLNGVLVEELELIDIPGDGTPPEIQFIPPTPANNSINTTGYVNITVNVTDPSPGSDIDVVNVSVWNETGIYLDNETMHAFDEHKYYYNALLPNGNYTYKVYAKDVAGNMGVSETRVVKVNMSVLKGDANGNGIIDANDAFIVLRASVGLETVDLAIGDVNNNGIIDADDAFKILRASVGLETI
jgi:hypothetical protein